MVYDSNGITKSLYSREEDKFLSVNLEAYLFSSKLFHESIAELMESELRNINPQNQISLQEAFSIKNMFTKIFETIKIIFSKIWEAFQTFDVMLTSMFKASDQLLAKNIKLLNKKYEKYAKNIKFKAALPNEQGFGYIMGNNGSDLSDEVISFARDAKRYISFNQDKDSSVDNIIMSMDTIRGKVLNTSPISEKDFKTKIDEYLFLPEKEYVGVSSEVFNMVKTVMQISPDLITRSWNRDCEKEMKTLLNEIKNLEKDYSNDSDESKYHDICKIKVYMVGCSQIISAIHKSFMAANLKLIKQCRKIFMTLIRTLKQPKSGEIESQEGDD